MSKIVEKETN